MKQGIVVKIVKGERREHVLTSWDSKLSHSLPFLKTAFEYSPFWKK
jgi:hypothetical protein